MLLQLSLFLSGLRASFRKEANHVPFTLSESTSNAIICSRHKGAFLSAFSHFDYLNLRRA